MINNNKPISNISKSTEDTYRAAIRKLIVGKFGRAKLRSKEIALKMLERAIVDETAKNKCTVQQVAFIKECFMKTKIPAMEELVSLEIEGTKERVMQLLNRSDTNPNNVLRAADDLIQIIAR